LDCDADIGRGKVASWAADGDASFEITSLTTAVLVEPGATGIDVSVGLATSTVVGSDAPRVVLAALKGALSKELVLIPEWKKSDGEKESVVDESLADGRVSVLDSPVMPVTASFAP
jgi:hypothetical protein